MQDTIIISKLPRTNVLPSAAAYTPRGGGNGGGGGSGGGGREDGASVSVYPS